MATKKAPAKKSAEPKKASKKSSESSAPPPVVEESTARALGIPAPPTQLARPVETVATTSSGGGPVVLLPADVASLWRGTLAPINATVPAGWTWGTEGGPRTDYDRALQPEDFSRTARGGIGWLPIGGAAAIILADELVTAWIPTAEGGVIVRGPDIKAAHGAAIRASIPIAGWKHLLGELVLRDGRVFLFDSAFAGATNENDIIADGGVVVGKPGSGVYRVEHLSLETTDFIRLTRMRAIATAESVLTPRAEPVEAPTESPLSPQWKTRSVPPDQLPRSSDLIDKFELATATKLRDGSVIGIERGKLSESHAVRISPEGTRTRLSRPGQFSSISLSLDGQTLFAVSGDGKVWAFPASGDSNDARVVFDGRGAVWSVTPLTAKQAAIAQDGTVHLVDTSANEWRTLDSVSVKPVTLPIVDAVGEGHWLVVGRSPKIRLFAVQNEALVMVQGWQQTEGGASVIDGRLFLYTAGNPTREEVLNLPEVYRSLA